MYSMLIVDDNPLDRKNIAAFLDWNAMGIQVAGVYRNGKAVLEQLDNLKPDIILTDIQMPVVDGRELAARVKELYPATRIVFMSSYDEFDYAKLAIRLEVDDYILKPIVKAEILKTMEKIVSKLKMYEQQRREREGMLAQLNKSLALYQEQFLRDLLFGNFSSTEEIKGRMDLLGIDLAISRWLQVLYLRIVDDEIMMNGMNISDKYFTAYSIKKMIRDRENDLIHMHIVQLSDKDYAIIAGGSSEPDDGGESLLNFVIELKEHILEQLHLNTLLGVSSQTDSLTEISTLYRMSLEAISTKYYSGSAQVIHYKDIVEQNQSLEDMLDFQQLYKDIKHLLTEADTPNLEWFLQKYLIGLTPSPNQTYIQGLILSCRNALQIMFLENGKPFSQLIEIGEGSEGSSSSNRADGLKRVADWFRQSLMEAREQLFAGSKPQYEQIVDDIKRIIAETYRQQITVGDIANAIYISPSHANHIFKTQTGRTIFDYMIEYRIEAAKTLLRQPSSRVYLVAQEVGYTNKSHFCLLFKKMTGMTPMEFKNGIIPQLQR